MLKFKKTFPFSETGLWIAGFEGKCRLISKCYDLNDFTVKGCEELLIKLISETDYSEIFQNVRHENQFC